MRKESDSADSSLWFASDGFDSDGICRMRYKKGFGAALRATPNSIYAERVVLPMLVLSDVRLAFDWSLLPSSSTPRKDTAATAMTGRLNSGTVVPPPGQEVPQVRVMSRHCSDSLQLPGESAGLMQGL